MNWSLICKLNGFSRRLLSTSTNNHPYDNVIPFKTNKQLANYLSDNILYEGNGLFVVNKPYGICFSKDTPQWKKNKTEIQNPNIIRHRIQEILSMPKISTEEDKINLHDAFPYLKSNLNCETLCIIKSPEKYTSGVCILGSSEKVRTKVIKCWERSRAQKIALESYLAICSGVPVKPRLYNFRIGISLDVSDNGKRKKAVLTNNYSKRDVLKSKVKVAIVHSFLLSANSDSASLVKIVTNQKKWHFVRLFLANQLLAPAIGDHLFSSRVKRLMGTAVAVDYWSDYASQPQKLDSDLLVKLDLRPGSEKYIPTMIHLSELTLLNFINKSKDLVLYAPPHSYFTWTMDKLGLHLPTTELSLVNQAPESRKTSLVN